MPADLPALLEDLAAETQVTQDMLAGRDAAAWLLPTPAAGWTIHDQISHLAFFDETATLAATDPDRFRQQAAELMALGDAFPDQVARRYRAMPAPDLMDWFRRARADLIATFGAADPAARLPWYGPDMSPATSVTARLMETWAHGQDVADTLQVTRAPTARLRHIARLGVRTFGFTHRLHGLPEPGVPVRVDLTAPGGGTWDWGPDDAKDTVCGPAVDFCLVVTQRRHVDDTSLEVDGPVAAQWMRIAQAFAGPPGPGRQPAAHPAAAVPGPGSEPGAPLSGDEAP
jgi:uncharacterized protein (TIGR03084 family)